MPPFIMQHYKIVSNNEQVQPAPNKKCTSFDVQTC